MNVGRGYYIREIDGKFYPFFWDEDKVIDIETGRWFADMCDEGVRYVSYGRNTYKAAYEAIRSRGATKANGKFNGIW